MLYPYEFIRFLLVLLKKGEVWKTGTMIEKDLCKYLKLKGASMLYYSIVFFIVAIIAAILGFGGIAGAAAGIAKILFYIFLVLLILSLVFGRRRF